MTTREVLVEARKLIEKPENWASEGSELSPTKHCMATALSRVVGRRNMAGIPAYRLLCDLTPGEIPSEFNDTHSHGEGGRVMPSYVLSLVQLDGVSRILEPFGSDLDAAVTMMETRQERAGHARASGQLWRVYDLDDPEAGDFDRDRMNEMEIF